MAAPRRKRLGIGMSGREETHAKPPVILSTLCGKAAGSYVRNIRSGLVDLLSKVSAQCLGTNPVADELAPAPTLFKPRSARADLLFMVIKQ